MITLTGYVNIIMLACCRVLILSWHYHFIKAMLPDKIIMVSWNMLSCFNFFFWKLHICTVSKNAFRKNKKKYVVFWHLNLLASIILYLRASLLLYFV
jgi:hypothetical protein